MFREIVHSQPDTSNLPPSFANVLRPYVDLLLEKRGDAAATAEIFAATQLMVRPGLAQTQAVLARELSGGTDDASRLFRQSVTLTRQAERARIELARLTDITKPDARGSGALAHGQAPRSSIRKRSSSPPSRRWPASRATAPCRPGHSARRPAEGASPGRSLLPDDHRRRQVYAFLVTPTAARAAKLGATASQLGDQVKALRETISTVENGQRITYPFDVGAVAPALRRTVRPVRGRDRGVEAPDLRARRRDASPSAQPAGDGPGLGRCLQEARAGERRCGLRLPRIAWLGRDRDISTSVSPRSFAQLRSAPPSAARKEYLGLGQNTPPSAAAAGARPRCRRPRLHASAGNWAHPISAKELQVASAMLAAYDPSGGPGRHRRRLHRHRRSRAAPISTSIGSSISRPTAWSPRRREVRRPARAADQLRRQRLGRAADLQGSVRPPPRRRPRHPLGVRHRRQGEPRGDPAGGPRHRRRCRARRPRARLRRRRRAAGARQPLAGFGRLKRPSG